MDLRQLSYFREIADSGSINKAAHRLHMSQPPLSYQIKQLEEELGVSLFERGRTGVTLTEAGKLLYDRSGDLINYARSLELEVAHAGKSRVLRLGLTSTTVNTLLPYIAAFSAENPDVNYEIHDGMTYTLYSYLLDGIIDLSVVRTPLALDEVEHAVLRSEGMISVSKKESAENKPIKTDEKIRLCDLQNERLVLYRRYESLITEAFSAHGVKPNLFCRCDDARDALLWAKEGLATAVFPQSMKAQCAGMRVREIDEALLETQILLVWRKDRKLTPLVQRFIRLCTDSK